MKTCKECGSTKNKFYRTRAICALCVATRRIAKGYKRSKETQTRNNIRSRAKFRGIKEDLVSERDSTCFICGKMFPPEVFDFHHLDPSTKIKEVSLLAEELAKQEAEKCIMICANCHRMVHTGHIPKEAYAENHGTKVQHLETSR